MIWWLGRFKSIARLKARLGLGAMPAIEMGVLVVILKVAPELMPEADACAHFFLDRLVQSLNKMALEKKKLTADEFMDVYAETAVYFIELVSKSGKKVHRRRCPLGTIKRLIVDLADVLDKEDPVFAARFLFEASFEVW